MPRWNFTSVRLQPWWEKAAASKDKSIAAQANETLDGLPARILKQRLLEEAVAPRAKTQLAEYPPAFPGLKAEDLDVRDGYVFEIANPANRRTVKEVANAFWGEDPAQACRFANVADQSRFQVWGFGQKHECTDGHYFTTPAGGYAPNRFGLYDMLGNAWEWTEDCWNASYAGAPSDGAAWLAGDCGQRVLRGGSWSTVPRYARSATRFKNPADFRDNLTGFRLARTLE